MPKLIIDSGKGLKQETGTGLLIKSNPIFQGQTAMRRKTITWAADTTLTRQDSGALVFCDQQSTAIDLELPTAAVAGAGWFIDVILTTASSAAANIDFQADTAQVLIYLADGGTDSEADTNEQKQSVNFTANATVNSSWHIFSDGSNYYCHGRSGTTNEMAIADTGV